ncbi:hypothetical protein [Actinomycetospora sp. TBRC 11914]|uniref:hypothetical protein n=1 Tax=Actinomycetospora sp. TBRC 11914 TaxID=2729387 RepID=UPI00145EF59F|nr:hypothetical protein [Actinomycetospora sp. TBRC 11914]NMO93901.1 hypothetical protein [Actinomycetospora sp. TBRC 11914]
MATSLAVTPTGLRVRFTGPDRVAACSRGLHVPFPRIIGSRVMTRRDAVASSPHLPCPGAWWPGALRVGAWGIGERRQLWAVRRSTYVVVVYLSGRPFHRVVLDVEDPRGVHRAIEAALLESKRTSARESLRDLLAARDDVPRE